MEELLTCLMSKFKKPYLTKTFLLTTSWQILRMLISPWESSSIAAKLWELHRKCFLNLTIVYKEELLWILILKLEMHFLMNKVTCNQLLVLLNWMNWIDSEDSSLEQQKVNPLFTLKISFQLTKSLPLNRSLDQFILLCSGTKDLSVIELRRSAIPLLVIGLMYHKMDKRSLIRSLRLNRKLETQWMSYSDQESF